MRFGSLFAGIGGFDLGLERAGMECAWQVEIDDYCSKVLQKHWPDVPKYKDIRDVGKHNLEPVDLICGGFPCQPYSVAGKRRGEADDRHLWPEMLRVITELKPTWVVGENVPGIIPLFLDQALSDLENQGYSTEPVVLPAVAFDAPHRRDRLFIVAYSEKMRQRRGTNKRRGNGRNLFLQEEQEGGKVGREVERCRKDVADTARRSCPSPNGRYRWAVEPGVGRVASGVPRRVDRLRALGNAVVPAVAEHIGRMILEASPALASYPMTGG